MKHATGNGNLYKDLFFVYILTLQFDDATVKAIYCIDPNMAA